MKEWWDWASLCFNSPVWGVQHLVWKFYLLLVEKIATDLTDLLLLHPHLPSKSQNRKNLQNKTDLHKTVQLAGFDFFPLASYFVSFSPWEFPPTISLGCSAPSFCAPVSSACGISSQTASLASHFYLSVNLHNHF